jgi:hypothetical protein
MAYAITRRALNEAWSGRTAKVTRRPFNTLAAAVAFAAAQVQGTLTITDTESGQFGKVARYANTGDRISVDMPLAWWAELIKT